MGSVLSDKDQSSVIWLEIKTVAPLINKAGGNTIELLLWSRGRGLDEVRRRIGELLDKGDRDVAVVNSKNLECLRVPIRNAGKFWGQLQHWGSGQVTWQISGRIVILMFSKDHGDDDMDMETLEIGDQQRFEAMVSDGIRALGMEIPGDVD